MTSGDARATEVASADTLVSLGNALKLGTGLIVTWCIAIGIRVVLPRFLGPEPFGTYQFAEAFAGMFFVVTGLGVETYIRKEVATRTGHASQFFAGLFATRILLSAGVMVAMALVLHFTGRSASVQRLVFLFGGAQILLTVNDTYAALLHAANTVNGLTLVNVGSKLLWAGGTVLGLSTGGGIDSIAIALIASETLKLALLSGLARRHLQLRWQFDLAATRAVLIASLPFFVGVLAQSVSSRTNVILLSYMSTDREVGWYSAASNIASLALLMTPLIGWVLLPMVSRAAARSEAELFELLHRALEIILAVAMPLSLMLYLSADWLCATVFGPAFTPAVASLRILAPMFILTYVAMLGGTTLIRLERGWAVTLSSVAGVVLNPILSFALIGRCLAAYGPGGAGIGASIAAIITEACILATLMFLVGRRSVDRRNIDMIVRTLGVCAAVWVCDALLRGRGGLRLIVDLALYSVLVVAVRAVRPREIFTFLREALKRTEPAHAPQPR